jgi:RNA polymerase sigma-70 factor (ECF subfamily)
VGGSEERAALEAQPDRSPELEELWEREYQQNLFAVVAAQVRGDFQESTWQAFWLTAVEGQAPTQVAADLNLSVAAVYLAKSRVMARLKERVRDLHEP